MFTGIISELGTVTDRTEGNGVVRLAITAPGTVDGLALGDSVAVNGVCLTAIDIDEGRFDVEMVSETLSRTSLDDLAPDDRVNLERPLGASGRFDGHIVQGHVDGVGTIAAIAHEGDARRVTVRMPSELSKYVVEKGSIAVDGTSLTVTAVSDRDASETWFEFVLIPHTLEVTVLGRRRTGEIVNLEVDMIAKQVERLLEHRS